MDTEPRWPAIVAVLAVGGLHLALPSALSFGPSWLLLAIVTAMIVPTVLSYRVGMIRLNEWLGYALSAVLTLSLLYAIGALVHSLTNEQNPHLAAPGLLRAAALLWATTVLVFASWYWRLDAGGPNTRDLRRQAGEPHTRGAFLFPQMTLDPETLRQHCCDIEEHWHPEFVDYLFLAFTASTAFSPTDVPVLSRWAKGLMMVQAIMSLATLALLAARAVNIL
jgi:uncharacterized membrane protein